MNGGSQQQLHQDQDMTLNSSSNGSDGKVKSRSTKDVSQQPPNNFSFGQLFDDNRRGEAPGQADRDLPVNRFSQTSRMFTDSEPDMTSQSYLSQSFHPGQGNQGNRPPRGKPALVRSDSRMAAYVPRAVQQEDASAVLFGQNIYDPYRHVSSQAESSSTKVTNHMSVININKHKPLERTNNNRLGVNVDNSPRPSSCLSSAVPSVISEYEIDRNELMEKVKTSSFETVLERMDLKEDDSDHDDFDSNDGFSQKSSPPPSPPPEFSKTLPLVNQNRKNAYTSQFSLPGTNVRTPVRSQSVRPWDSRQPDGSLIKSCKSNENFAFSLSPRLDNRNKDDLWLRSNTSGLSSSRSQTSVKEVNKNARNRSSPTADYTDNSLSKTSGTDSTLSNNKSINNNNNQEDFPDFDITNQSDGFVSSLKSRFDRLPRTTEDSAENENLVGNFETNMTEVLY